MKKIKTGLLLLTTLMLGNFVKAQTIEEGRKALYYDKYRTSAAVFQKLLDANANNADAAYWLGQSWLAEDNTNTARVKELYRKTLEANSNSALLTAGMGHVELLEGKTQDARNRFETAISLSQGKSIPVLNAIGLANADFDSKLGDAAYAIQKLRQATAIKGFKDPETYTLLGDAYRKFADGGNALQSYESALAIDPRYARAKYRIGRIYQTQGASQNEIMMRYYNEAIAIDPAYTPVYFTLYQYYYESNVPRSAEYLEKYLTAKGTDATDACDLRSSILYAQGQFQQSINKSLECIAAEGAASNPIHYGRMAYAYNRLNDSMNAKKYFDEYFQKQKPAKIGPADYKTYAEVLLKFPGNETLAGNFMEKAIEADSTEAGKVALVKSVAQKFEAQKMYKDAADWYKRLFGIKKVPGKTDLYYAGYNYYRAGEYQQAINYFETYGQKYPDESFGFFMNARSYEKLDSLDASGNARKNYFKVVDMTNMIKDKPGEKDRIKGSLRSLVEFYANVKRDKDSALLFTEKGILLDPADTEFTMIKEQLSKITLKPAPPAKPAKPATTKPVNKGTSAVKPAATKVTKTTTTKTTVVKPKVPVAKKK